MSFGRRLDSRRSSSNCLMTILIAFVTLCLLGVWMRTSPPIQTADISISRTTSDINKQVHRSDPKPFVDSSGDIPEEGNTNIKENIDVNESNNESLDTLPFKHNEGQTDGSKSNKSHEIGQDKIKEKSFEEAIKNKEEETAEQISDEKATGEKKGNSKNISNQIENNEQQQFDGDKEFAKKEKADAVTMQDERGQGQLEEKGKQSQDKQVYLDVAQPELLKDTSTKKGSWSTQDTESKNEKEIQSSSSSGGQMAEHIWMICDATADYIPCLDNEKATKALVSNMHYEHRERHCPEKAPTCLVRIPDGYKQPIQWPMSRNKTWYKNTPYTQLSVVKGGLNWVKFAGEYLIFPGGGTQFRRGALHYIDKIQETLPDIAWGKRSRTILDVGCGVASFGGYLFERDVLTMSFAPKDEHEAQVQFALERGIPAISAVMGTKRLPFPSRVFDAIHCARCRVPWHIEGGMLLLELNRLLRPGGYFLWSATPVYQKLEEDVEIWNAMYSLTKSMCWKVISRTMDKINRSGFAIYQKPSNNACYYRRTENNPPLCQESDDPNASWNIPLQACIHKLPTDPSLRGSQWPKEWPLRLGKVPYWINNSQVGVYGKSAPEDIQADYERWKLILGKSYLSGIGISWSTVRNVMDMRAVYGGFAAALTDMKVWVMNVVSIDSPDTLPIIYERGLFGMYHDWCESFSTYPRSYDLLHADHLFSEIKKRCKILPVIAEVDRILRPNGKLIIRDDAETISQLETMAKSLHWNVRPSYSMDNEGLLCVEKTMWRPEVVESITPAMS